MNTPEIRKFSFEVKKTSNNCEHRNYRARMDDKMMFLRFDCPDCGVTNMDFRPNPPNWPFYNNRKRQ